MKKIINQKRYDTDTAKELGYWTYSNRRDFAYVCETLYQKKTGEFFLHGEGGPSSKYAESCGMNEWCGSEKIIPLDYETAREWSEEHLSADEYESIFGEVEEDDSKTTVTLSLSGTTIQTLKQLAARTGKTQSEIVESAILNIK